MSRLFADVRAAIAGTQQDYTSGSIGRAVLLLSVPMVRYVFWGFGMVTVHAFNDAGDTKTPTWIHLVAYWIFQLPLAVYLSGPAGFGSSGVFASLSAGQVLLAVLGVIWFRRGRWKSQEI